jgi:hypothetical protein
MAYTFETSRRGGIYVARIGGERHKHIADNFDELWAFWSSVALEMRQEGLNRLLAVISAIGTLRSLDVRTFYRRLSEMGFMANMRLAVVVEPLTHERPVLELGVGAAALDGWTIRLFASESDAVAWLLSDL